MIIAYSLAFTIMVIHYLDFRVTVSTGLYVLCLGDYTRRNITIDLINMINMLRTPTLQHSPE